jgi:hypothetical protein
MDAPTCPDGFTKSLLRILALLGGLWILVAIPFLTDAGCNILVGGVLALCWFVGGLFWYALALSRPALLRSRPERYLWLGIGIVGVLGLLLAKTDIGLIARVALCEETLASYAEQVPPEGEALSLEPRQVGLFYVNRVQNYDGVVFLHTSSYGWLDEAGIAYVKPGTHALIIDRRSRHLFGPWYWFYWHS